MSHIVRILVFGVFGDTLSNFGVLFPISALRDMWYWAQFRVGYIQGSILFYVMLGIDPAQENERHASYPLFYF